ncbi:MAG TPA: N-acetylmuramoyl-L-alanine amidase, partial [Syntrophomonas sp.]|nr:N-acetylmuramoyl-L-alanine amidase [Syntrophomonas sp.]
MKIGIDPGHGGEDPGAVGPGGTYEKDVNLAIAQRVQFLLSRMGIETLMTRSDDSSKSLMTRSNSLNGARVDFAISIHCNSSANPGPNYISTYIQAAGGEAELLAMRVQARMAQST